MLNQEYNLNYIINRIPERPIIGIVLGSGLGEFINQLSGKIQIPYHVFKGFPISTISGHAGEWVFGYIHNIPIICASGRFHIYEGFCFEEVVMPIDIINNLGCKKIIITNSAGCLNTNWNIGDFMLIQGFIDYSYMKNSNNCSIIKLNSPIGKIEKVQIKFNNIGYNIRSGIYTWTLGPTYETPAEIKDIISLGGHAVGMSTVPELIRALEFNLDVIGLSCLTNYGAGIINKNLSHDDVLKISMSRGNQFSEILSQLIQLLN